MPTPSATADHTVREIHQDGPEEFLGRWLAGCGIAGPVLLALYFILPALIPSLRALLYGNATPSTGQIVTVGAHYHLLLTFGGWMQGMAATLCVVFLLALAHWSGAGTSLPGRLLLLGSAVLVGVALAEMLFTFTWASAAAHGQATTARAAYDLMTRFIQVFTMVPAPAVYLALTAVLTTGRPMLPPIFTCLAALLGIGFFLLGLVAIVAPQAGAAAGGLSDLWILAAGITILRSPSRRTAC